MLCLGSSLRVASRCAAEEMSTALVTYEPTPFQPLTSPTRSFTLQHAGPITISQGWGQDGARTGAAVWDASLVLADYIDRLLGRQRHPPEGWTGLELGAGLGLASIAAARDQ